MQTVLHILSLAISHARPPSRTRATRHKILSRTWREKQPVGPRLISSLRHVLLSFPSSSFSCFSPRWATAASTTTPTRAVDLPGSHIRADNLARSAHPAVEIPRARHPPAADPLDPASQHDATLEGERARRRGGLAEEWVLVGIWFGLGWVRRETVQGGWPVAGRRGKEM
jgi:hypothetical protein